MSWRRQGAFARSSCSERVPLRSPCGVRDSGGTRNVRRTSAAGCVHRSSTSFVLCRTNAFRGVHLASTSGVLRCNAPIVECVTPALTVSYIIPAPVADYVTPVLAVHAAHALVLDNFAPAPTVYAAPAPVVEYIVPSPPVHAAPASWGTSPTSPVYVDAAPAHVVEYIAPALAVCRTSTPAHRGGRSTSVPRQQ